MPLKHITSRDNPVYRGLLELAESRQARRDQGLTLVDGNHLLEEALLAGITPRRLVFVEGHPELGLWGDRLPEVPLVSLPMALFRKLSPVTTPSGLLAVIGIPRGIPRPEPQFGMLLEAVQDPGNLGALLRSGAAAGVDAVHLSTGCAEAWSPKTLRGGQGAQFHLDVHERSDLESVARDFPGQVYAALPAAGRSLYSLTLTGPTAFVFGNEGAGLGEAVLRHAEAFSIPMPGHAESLNVAAAAAVCLFERVRQLAVARGSA
jgi:TrmH family RNA methyltransferase